MLNNRTLIISLSSVITVCAIVALVFFLFRSNNIRTTESQDIFKNASKAVVAPTVSSTDAPEGFKEYGNTKYGFSLFYPEDFSVNEYKEEGGAITIVFQDAKMENGFQIFVVPYGESQVTQERFKMDVPSGIMNEPVNVIIDGVQGTMFFSEDAFLGDTREVWFIRGGFLFEVTTNKDLDAWLSNIMATWKFQ